MKKKILALVLCLVFLMAPIATVGVSATADPGYTLSGTTYTVTTADGLIAVAAAINDDSAKAAYNVILAADIDMQGKTWTPIGAKGKTAYAGTFDGGNFTIKNLSLIVDYQTVGAAGYCSLIGKANEGCTVKNVKFTGANVQGVELNSLVIGETAQKDATDTTRKILIENVHIRNSDIKGSNGWGTVPTGVNKNEYTGALIGKATALHTEINNCSVFANITSECRTAGLVGGEAVGSNYSMTISNCIVGGSITQGKVATGSNTLKDGGATAFFGYSDKFVYSLTNCVSVATIAAEQGTAGALGFDSKKLSLTATNCAVVGDVFGRVYQIDAGYSSTLVNVSVYDPNATTDKVAVVKNLNSNGDNPIKVDGVDTTWAAATVPVVTTSAAFNTKVTTIFAGNSVITANVIEEFIGHEHSYAEVVDAKFLKSVATCTSAAVYYKSCTCGGFDANATFTSGDPIAHTPSDKWSSDDDNHWHVCASCLEEKSDVAAHTYGDWKVTKEPTEKKEGEKTKTCTVCGHEVTEKVEKLAPATETAAETEAEAQKGCGGTVLGMGVVMIATLGAGALVMRKKED